MTRLQPPTRQVPPGAKQGSTSTTTTTNNNNGKSKLQIFLLVTIGICVVLTVCINIQSTSASVMDMHHYGAAVHQAIQEFKQQGAFVNSEITAVNIDSSNNIDIGRKQDQQQTPPLSPPLSPKTATTTTTTHNNDDHNEKVSSESEIASLSCAKHGGPPDEFAQEMVYWSDVPSDSLYVSPFLRQKQQTTTTTSSSSRRQYMTFEPDGGGWNNIRMAMETVVGMAAAMGRTLVLPPQKVMYLLGNGKNQQRRHFGFEDFFPMQQMAQENAALDMITMQEFLETEAMTGQLKDRQSGQVSFPPYNRTDWNGMSGKEWDELREWLRNVTLVPQWNPDRCLAAFPAKGDAQSVQELQEMQQQIHKEGISHEAYIGKPVPVDGPAIDRMKENLNNRRNLCVYDESMQQEPVVHFACAHKLQLRLLVHFYAFIFMEDWKEDLWMKRFMRDHMRYNDDIQCAAARIVHAMRKLARQNDPIGNPDGMFDTFHIRRGDFQYKNTRIPADEIHLNTKDALVPNATIYIATDERDKKFFDPLRQHYNIYFLDDFMTDLEGVNTNYYGMLDQLVASRGKTFFGCWFSTFTGFINRMRGYRSVKDKLPGYKEGVLPTSYYYAMKDRKKALHEYMPLSGSFFAREFPTSWRDIDQGIGMLPQATG